MRDGTMGVATFCRVDVLRVFICVSPGAAAGVDRIMELRGDRRDSRSTKVAGIPAGGRRSREVT